MKLLLVVLPLVLALPGIALADHIGIYSDASGSSCSLATGLNPNITVIHKYSLGALGSHFGVTFPAGSTVFGFTCSTCPIGGSSIPDANPYYGGCMTGNSIVVGTIIAALTTGTVSIVPATGLECVVYTDCADVQKPFDSVGNGYAGVFGPCDPLAAEASAASTPCVVATEPSTWGSVKALYRN